MDNLIWFILAGVILYYFWESGEFKARALILATTHCKQLQLQLLDQSMVIRGLWPHRDQGGAIMLRRTYQFEFTSTGEQRYYGRIVMLGMLLHSIEVDTYKLPESE